ncbi:class I adenylate-forming enzyme family protein [Rhodococcus sp. IEGM1428]|uniref:class I adenylate-forming enzyme family protein n=1 Tax=Rhodococcus sp. IEGM1428 TaxID=3392191 RepID=UPI003D0F4873
MDDPVLERDQDLRHHRNIDSVVRRAADEFGDRECLRFEGISLSFREFEAKTREIATRLPHLGIGIGDHVGIMMPNGHEWPIIWVAILRAGAVAVPMNAKLGVADLSFLVSDSRVRIIITNENESISLLETAISRSPTPKPNVFSFNQLIDQPIDSRLSHINTGLPSPPPDTVANLQYTSGTTGFPKACVLTHKYWIEHSRAIGDLWKLSSNDVVLTAQPFSYVDPPWNLAMCLQFGAPLVVLSRFSASGFWKSVRDNRATVVYILGAMPMLLYKQAPSYEDRANCLRLVSCSGILPERHRDFEDRWGVPWRELYGLTEEGCCLAVPLSAEHKTGSGSIGIPFGNKLVKLVDDTGVEVAPGERGEIVVQGDSIMRSYWNRPEESTKALPNGWFHTGDIAWRDPDGWFYLVGRVKDMIRRGGENIAAAEVEAVLNDHPWVEISAVIPEPDDIMGEEPKACIKLGKDGLRRSPDEVVQSVAEFAASQLAKFKNPRYIQIVDSLPRTPSERIAKKQLRELLLDGQREDFDVKEKFWRTPGSATSVSTANLLREGLSQ